MENLPANAPQPPESPFGRMLANTGGMNVGAVAIEQERAIAEAQGQLILAKKFPRSMAGAMSEFLDTCASSDFAKTAFYTVKNRGSGPSIRFAEEAARCYGNFQFGHRELSRVDGKSEVEVYAWDMQNNNYSRRQITVMHVLDTQDGPRKLVQQADIDNKIANVASKQMRGRILALLPKHLVAAGVEKCKLTLSGGSEVPIRERILKMSQAFNRFGVTDVHITQYLGHAVDQTTSDELADLMGIYNAIKEGAKASDYFGQQPEQAAANHGTAAAIAAQAAAAPAAAAPASKPTQRRAAAAQAEGNVAKEAAAAPAEKPAAAPPAAAPEPAPAPAPAAAPAPTEQPPADAGGATDDVF